MSHLALPLEMFDMPTYRRLRNATQRFLIDLYVVFFDCERFTIDITTPQLYRQTPGAMISTRINELVDAGILIAEREKLPGKHARRVYQFAYPPKVAG